MYKDIVGFYLLLSYNKRNNNSWIYNIVTITACRSGSLKGCWTNNGGTGGRGGLVVVVVVVGLYSFTRNFSWVSIL